MSDGVPERLAGFGAALDGSDDEHAVEHRLSEQRDETNRRGHGQCHPCCGQADHAPDQTRLSPFCLMRGLGGSGLFHEAEAVSAQHFLNFLPLPQGQGSLRPIFGAARAGCLALKARSMSLMSSGFSGSSPIMHWIPFSLQKSSICWALSVVWTRTMAGFFLVPMLAMAWGRSVIGEWATTFWQVFSAHSRLFDSR